MPDLIGCPFCGGPVVNNLKIDIGEQIAFVGEKHARFHPLQTDILYILNQHFASWVGLEVLIKGAYGASFPEDPKQSVRVAMAQMRPKLKKLGIQILHRHNGQYMLMRDDR